MASKWTLRIVSGPDAGKAVELSKMSTSIGRARGDVILREDDEISGRHALLLLSAEGDLTVRDLKSHNGTKVNGTRIEKEKVLGPGDRIRIGTTELIVEHEAPKPLAETVPPPIPQDQREELLKEAKAAAAAVIAGSKLSPVPTAPVVPQTKPVAAPALTPPPNLQATPRPVLPPVSSEPHESHFNRNSTFAAAAVLVVAIGYLFMNGPSGRLVRSATDREPASAEIKPFDCDSDLHACNELGKTLLESGRKREALDQFKQACAAKYGPACGNVGRMYQFGDGVAASASMAFAFYSQSCTMNFGAGCREKAEAMFEGRGTEKSEPAAREIFQHACQLGDAQSCSRAIAIPH